MPFLTSMFICICALIANIRVQVPRYDHISMALFQWSTVTKTTFRVTVHQLYRACVDKCKQFQNVSFTCFAHIWQHHFQWLFFASAHRHNACNHISNHRSKKKFRLGAVVSVAVGNEISTHMWMTARHIWFNIHFQAWITKIFLFVWPDFISSTSLSLFLCLFRLHLRRGFILTHHIAMQSTTYGGFFHFSLCSSQNI